MLPIILCLFEGLNDLRLVYNDCEKIYFITFVKVGVAIYNDHTVLVRTKKLYSKVFRWMKTAENPLV